MIYSQITTDYERGKNRNYPTEINKVPPGSEYRMKLIYNQKIISVTSTQQHNDRRLEQIIPEINDTDEIIFHMVLDRHYIYILNDEFPGLIYNFENL